MESRPEEGVTPRTELRQAREAMDSLRKRVAELEAAQPAPALPESPTKVKPSAFAEQEAAPTPPATPTAAEAGAGAEADPEPEAPDALQLDEPEEEVAGLRLPLEELPPMIRKIAAQVRATMQSDPRRSRFAVLVLSGSFCPLHARHTRHLYLTRRYLQAQTEVAVVGALLSPSHDTEVRLRMRQRLKQMIPSRLRIGACRQMASTSSWIDVDEWELTRRRVMDYLAVLAHVREVLDAWFPGLAFQLVYVTSGTQLLQINPTALREEGFTCATVCRPGETEARVQELDGRYNGVVHLVEDGAVLPVDLARSSPQRVRQALVGGADPLELAPVLGEPVAAYLAKHKVGEKMAGRVPWSAQDKRPPAEEERRRSGSCATSAPGSRATSRAGSRSSPSRPSLPSLPSQG